MTCFVELVDWKVDCTVPLVSESQDIPPISIISGRLGQFSRLNIHVNVPLANPKTLRFPLFLDVLASLAA